MSQSQARYRPDALFAFAASLLERAGLAADRARATAEILVEGDLLGRSTHGLALLAPYLRDLDEDRMARQGEPVTVADTGAAIVWDGRRLPGPWLVRRAIAEARSRILEHPVVTVSVRRSHHIACLQAYLKPVTDAGLVIVLMSSDPAAAGVAPHGGIASRITPNPIAAGLPAKGEPILIDVSMSTTTNAMVQRVTAEGGRLPGPWLVDAAGTATDNPSAIAGGRGAVLPLGGLDLGHKGYALALLVEALTSGLAGSGRADAPAGWTASVFLQLIDPDAFGGREAFVREMTHLAALCRATPVAPGRPAVRLPGEAALQRRRRHLLEGVALHAATMPALEPWAARFDVRPPGPID